MTQKVWGGRFREDPDELVNRFNASIDFDRRLYAYDIEGSIAHCKMLAQQKILTEEEASRITEALGQIRREIERGELPVEAKEFEDIHGLIEKALVDKVGELGEKLHTGRSRNDQVALDMRLYVRDAIERVMNAIRAVQRAIVLSAEKNFDIMMPGYTHLQRAQPVLLAHHLLAYYEMLNRDMERFRESLVRVNILPSGSAALAGSTFNLNREMMARELGFHDISRNSMDAVSDRDFVLEFLFHASLVMMHLSRMSEELILWSSEEFGFVNIADAYCTGSSIMPQKKNPDLPELVRGKSGRIYGHLIALLTTMKGLPLSYNKDMQEDKEGLFDTVDTLEICLEVMEGLLGAITFNAERLREAAQEGFLVATDLADYLVLKGLTFRRAHEVVGRLVLFAAEQNKELRDLSLEELQKFSAQIEEDVYGWLDPASCISRRNLQGGTGPNAVRESLKKAKEELGI